jgi:pimeloyl-ACP methyl ester carboxylesterase
LTTFWVKGTSFYEIKTKEQVLEFLDTKIKSYNEDPDKRWITTWKQLPTSYQISTSDHMIPPDVQQKFAKQMNATTISINASHASYVSHPDEIAKLIIDAAKGKAT